MVNYIRPVTDLERLRVCREGLFSVQGGTRRHVAEASAGPFGSIISFGYKRNWTLLASIPLSQYVQRRLWKGIILIRRRIIIYTSLEHLRGHLHAPRQPKIQRYDIK